MLHTQWHWLNALEKFPSHFSKYPELMEMLSYCDPNPVDVMSFVLREVLGGPCYDEDAVERFNCGARTTDVVERSTTPPFQHISLSLHMELEDGKRKASILYCFAIKQILMKETRRLGTRNHGQLVTKELFHRALLSICLDVVIKAKCLIGFDFPWAAKRAGTSTYDILRVIDSFGTIMDGELPVELKAHVRSVNIIMLECYAWKKTSSAKSNHDLLDVIHTHVTEGGQWGKDFTVSCADLVVDIDTNTTTSIEKAVKRRKKLQEEARLHSVGAASDRSASLSLIFSQLSSLCAERVYELCHVHLEMNDDFVSQVWTVAYQALVSKPILLRNHHLDTIILCSIYSISKVQEKTISNSMNFTTILNAYRTMMFEMKNRIRSTSRLFGNIDIHFVINDIQLNHETGKRGDIVDFYNQVFIPVMKHYVLDFQGLEKQLAEISMIKTVSDVHNVWNIVSGNDVMEEEEEKGLTATTIAKSMQPRRRHRIFTPTNNNLAYLQPLGSSTNGYRAADIVQRIPFRQSHHHNGGNMNHYYDGKWIKKKPGVYVTISASDNIIEHHPHDEEDMNTTTTTAAAAISTSLT